MCFTWEASAVIGRTLQETTAENGKGHMYA
jgi:hypothetical protein